MERKIDPSRWTWVVKVNKNEETTSEIYGIRLNDEEYQGFVYQYNVDRIGFSEPQADGSIQMQFDYAVLQLGKLTKEDLEKPEFKTLLGDILMDQITEQLETFPEDTIKFKTLQELELASGEETLDNSYIN